MATTALHHGAGRRHAPARTDASENLEHDRGPWLFLAAPVSFALTLIVLSWLSLSSLP